MKLVIGGASGLIGRAVASALHAAGHLPLRLVRGPAATPGEISWDPNRGELDSGALEGVDAVINLSGENVGAGRWMAARRERIMRSRVNATRTLVTAIGKLARKPRVFLSASAAGYYGNRGDEILTERSSVGHGFLPEVCLAWETHAEGAARQGVRTVLLRFGVVLAGEGGVLAKMLPVFRLGIGGRLGHGHQWMSWVSLDDVVGSILHALTQTDCAGPMNIVAPHAVTNRDFTKTLGCVLRRPTLLPVPAPILRLIFGRMADETLLVSQRAEPRRLQETGYSFRQVTLEPALRSALSC